MLAAQPVQLSGEMCHFINPLSDCAVDIFIPLKWIQLLLKV